MKKFVLFSLFAVLAIAVSAQYTTPRVGTGVRYDTRKLNYTFESKTDAAGADSVTLAPNAFVHTYRLVLVDSFVLKTPTVTNSYLGDQVLVIASAASGTPTLTFDGANWIDAGVVTLSTGLRAVIRFVFDGAKYVEESRVVQ